MPNKSLYKTSNYIFYPKGFPVNEEIFT